MTDKKKALGPGATCCEDPCCGVPEPELFTLDEVADELGLDLDDEEDDE